MNKSVIKTIIIENQERIPSLKVYERELKLDDEETLEIENWKIEIKHAWKWMLEG